MSSAVRKIIEAAKALTPAEQQELRTLWNGSDPSISAALPGDYESRLLSSGLVSRLPLGNLHPRPERQPIDVKGIPVSEMILQERR